ncbi:DUF1273 domain-containing protein [Ligilactobacillus saerimneri]|uniref:DUF1273 domain-containing protein n=1 Tax=Ligilactobacillus saerimneri TaxID=228229 RepID=UPI0024B97946|nr:DUF1273 domain-containing protein [Ligilactobacillus saerimneri]
MRLWITGYRSYELGVFQEKDEKIAVIKYVLRNALADQLDEGLEWVLTGGQLGVEQWAVETALAMKKEYSELKVALMEPFLDFGNRWQENKELHLADLRRQVDFNEAVVQAPYNNPQQLRQYQQFMVEHTDRCLLIYDPHYPGKSQYDFKYVKRYIEQEKTDYQLTLISMDELQDQANEYLEFGRQREEN